MKLQSLNDVVTNSSMEVYQEATQYTVNAVKDIINVILKISGSDKSCDDLFTVSIDYEDMFDSYFESCLDGFELDDEHLSIVEEIMQHRDDSGQLLSNSEVYNELVKTGLVGSVIPTIKEYTDTYDSSWNYPQTDVSIIPKGEVRSSDITILNRINNLFKIESCYN